MTFAWYLYCICKLTHLCQVDSSTSAHWTGLFPAEGVVGYFLLLQCCIEIRLCNVNSANPDQTPQYAASDPGLHCLLVSYLGRVKVRI